MKDILIKVKDSEYDFFLNLLSRFDFVELDKKDFFSDEQKEILDKRYEELKSGKVKGVEWETVEELLK